MNRLLWCHSTRTCFRQTERRIEKVSVVAAEVAFVRNSYREDGWRCFGMNAIGSDTAYDDAIIRDTRAGCYMLAGPENSRQIYSKRNLQEVSLDTRRALP